MKSNQILLKILLLSAALSGLAAPTRLLATDLMEAFALAAESDPEFRRVAAAKRAIMEQRPQAISQLLPSIQGRGTSYFNDQQIKLERDLVGRDGDVAFNSHGYSIDLTQPLFRVDRFLRLWQANSRISQAEAEYTSAQQDLMLRLAERYFTVLANLDNLSFARAEKKSLSRQLEQAQQRFDVGLTAITDVQEAQAGHDRAVAQEIAAENNVNNAREALREIIGAYPEALAVLGDAMPLIEPDPNDIETWTETALAQNLQVISAQYAVDATRTELKVQYAGHLPTLDAVARYGYDKSGGRFGSTQVKSDVVGLELNVPLFQGGFTTSRGREARARLDESLERLEFARRGAQRQTRESYLGVISGISQVAAFKQALLSSETALQATEAGFTVGTRTAVDVIDAERGRSEAKRDLARARYDYILSSLTLKQAAGTLTDADLQLINQWLTN